MNDDANMDHAAAANLPHRPAANPENNGQQQEPRLDSAHQPFQQQSEQQPEQPVLPSIEQPHQEQPQQDPPQEERLTIQVRSHTGDSITFKVKPTTTMGKLTAGYCSKLSKNAQSVRFLYEGQRITERDTPQSVRSTPSLPQLSGRPAALSPRMFG